ncbi:MAG: hypothetical protein GEU99_16970 [Luteitalea sp.]|nr:hypothetical protein [Luteitalea sp.]
MSLVMRRNTLQWLLVGVLALIPGMTTAQSGIVVLDTPCRLVDTRGDGERTGIVTVGTPRFFDLNVAGLSTGQGGDTECTGLPGPGGGTDWVVNITVTGFSANGALKVWGSDGGEPSTSIINYSAGHSPSVANGAIVKGCRHECVFFGDIRVRALGSPTHVIIDVVGYLPN